MGIEKRGRPEKVTAEIIHDILSTADEPMAVSELAEATDVSGETIRNHLDELENYPGVRKKKVGTAYVYWYDPEQWGLGDLNEGPIARLSSTSAVSSGALQIEARASLAHSRAEWLEARSWFTGTRGRTHTALEESVARRLGLLNALEAYMDQTHVHLPAAYADAEIDADDPEERVGYEAESYELDEENFEYYTAEIRLFPSSLDIWGLSSCLGEFLRLGDEIEGDDDLERLDGLLPPAEEILHAGDAYDEFLTGLTGVEW